jgi:ATP dependent DNA ligase domain
MARAGPFEVKHDGFRFIARRGGDRVRVFSRNARDWTDRVPLIVEAMLALPVTSATIDGEGVVVDERRVTDFERLRTARTWRLAGRVLVRFRRPRIRRRGPARPSMGNPLCDADTAVAQGWPGHPTFRTPRRGRGDDLPARVRLACGMRLPSKR